MVGNPWPALAILVLVRTGMGLQFQSVAAVGPALVAEFRLDYAALGSLVGAYLLPGVAVALPGGWLGARLGDLRLVRAGLALMALGGAASALAHGFPLLLAGRLAAGAGAALLNVFLAKMTTDLFAGRSLVVAMGWLLSAWPAGIGLALLTLGWVGAALSWRAALGATAAVALLGLALMAAYPTPRTEVGQKTSGASRLPPAVLAAVLAVGAMWALLNAALVVVLAFAPAHLVDRGLAPAVAGATTSVLSWVLIPALPLGGYVAARLGGPGAAIVGCCAAAALGIALLPWVGLPVVALALLGLLFGPPASLIMSLPASVLAPAERALGMGVYYTVYYAGMAGLPVLAGWARDRSGASAAPLYVAAALMALAGAGLPVFRALRRRAERG